MIISRSQVGFALPGQVNNLESFGLFSAGTSCADIPISGCQVITASLSVLFKTYLHLEIQSTLQRATFLLVVRFGRGAHNESTAIYVPPMGDGRRLCSHSWLLRQQDPSGQRQGMPLLPSSLYIIISRTPSRSIHQRQECKTP